MKKLTFLFIMVASFVLFNAFTNNKKSVKHQLETLSGTYADAAPYQYGKAWGKRVFTFSKGKWTLLFTLSLDPAMQMKVFEFRTLGKYEVKEASKNIANAYDAIFYEDKKFVTVKTTDENLKKAFGFSACNMETNIEKDISLLGCSAWKSVADCPADYDLLSIDKQGKLYFGERPIDNNMCSADKRPTKLTPPVVKL